MKMYIDLNSAVSEAPLAKKELNDLRWQLAEAQKALSECLAKQQEKPLGFQHWKEVFEAGNARLQKDADRFAFMEANDIKCRKRENGYWEATNETKPMPWVSRKTLAECIDVLMGAELGMED